MDPAIIELITRTMAIANFCASTPVNCTERKSRVKSVINRLIVLSTEMIMIIVGIRCLLSIFLIYIGTDSHCCYCMRRMIESMGVRMPVLHPDGNHISSHIDSLGARTISALVPVDQSTALAGASVSSVTACRGKPTNQWAGKQQVGILARSSEL